MREPFVVVAGSPRSGTSLLRTILRSNSSLIVHRTEPHYLLELHRRHGLTIRDVPAAVDFLLAHEKFPRDQIDTDAVRAEIGSRSEISLSDLLRTSYRIMRRARPDAPVVLKHPAFILHLDLIKALFPDLSVIHLIRDPRANAFSQRTRWPSTSLWTSATVWQASVDAGRSWQARQVTPYMELRYEDLVARPEAACRAVCDFLKVPFEPAMLASDHVEKQWNPSNPGQGEKRRYDGFEQQRIDKWRRFMTPVEVKMIEDQCTRGMKLFGYEPSSPQVAITAYVPYYLNERRRALQKAFKRWRRHACESAGAA
jgi:hypothetical protein